MAGAFVAVADDATATWWNPAGLAGGAYFDAVIESDRLQEPRTETWPAGEPAAAWRTSTRAFAAAFPSLGLSYYRLRISEIAPGLPTATGAAVREDQGTANVRLRALVLQQFGATVGQSIGEHLVVATTLKLVHDSVASDEVAQADASLDRAETLGGQGETHGDADVGAMATFGHVRLGLTVRNLRQPGFGEGADRVRLDRQARAGVSVSGPGRGALGALTVDVDADLTRSATVLGDERRLAGGVEAWLFGRRVSVRGGVSGSTIGASRRTTSGGLSLALRSGFYVEGMVVGGNDRARRGWGADLRVTY
ncbi:MAG: conjugal transfer protein TraF [Betaproteobacteria bacterium]